MNGICSWLAVISTRTNNVSFSSDYGGSWYQTDTAPFRSSVTDLWSSIYQTAPDEIAAVSSVKRSEGGNAVQIKFATLNGAISSGSTYVLESQFNSRYLSAKADQNYDGGGVGLWSWYSVDTQRWKVTDIGGGYFSICAISNNRCLSADKSNPQDGGSPIQYLGSSVDSQHWQIRYNGGGYYQLVNQWDNKFLSAYSDQNYDGGAAGLWPFYNVNTQFWTVAAPPQ